MLKDVGAGIINKNQIVAAMNMKNNADYECIRQKKYHLLG